MAKENKKRKDPKAEELDGVIQVEDQGSATDNSMDIKAPEHGSSEIKEVEEPKAAINTKKAAEVVSGGLNPIGSGGLRRGAGGLSGGAGGIRGDNSAITKENASYRSGTATGKRADPITRKADTVDADIFKAFRHEAKTISETREDQFYNGEYENEHVITQRRSGGVPADPNFERSIDEIDMDMLYYTEGQYNKPKNDENLSIHTWDQTLNNGAGGYSATTVDIPLGNHLCRKLTIQITKDTVNGTYKITGFDFDTTNLSLDKIDERTARRAGDAFLRMKNQTEKDRQVMVEKAGDESDAKWSCIAEAIIDSTDQNRAQRFLEGFGNFVYVSNRKLKHALAYQVWKLKKDGPRTTGPMAEMVNGHVEIAGYGADGAVSEANGRARCFSSLAYVNGGAGLYVAINDSLPKYTTKGKLLSLPLSFKAAVAVSDSQCSPLLMNDQLRNCIEKNELFSTIDGPYDPLKPIVVTDNIGLITPIPINTGCTLDTSTGELDTVVWVQHFENLRNKYNCRIRNYFVEGIFRWINERKDRIYEVCKDQASNNVVTINIPVTSSTTSISLWDLIVCSSVQYMVDARRTTLDALLKYEKNHGYPYTGLVHLSEVDFTRADNFSYADYESPLVDNVAKPIAAMKVIMPEVFWPVSKVNAEGVLTGHNGVGCYVALPHYFVQNQFKYTKDDDTDTPRQLILSDEYSTMAYPGTRDGSNFSFMDTIYGMSSIDYRLALDMMVVYPGYEPSYTGSKIYRAASAGSAKPQLAKTYKYGLVNDGTPVIPYFAYANSANHKAETLQVFDILATPRELGLMQVAPAGVLSPINKSGGTGMNSVALDSAYLAVSGPGFKIRVYHSSGSQQNTILNPGDVNLDNNQSVKYDWDYIYATPYSAGTDIGIKFNAGSVGAFQLNPFVSGSYAASYGTFDESTGVFTDSETKDTTIGIYTNMKHLWARIQRFPFAVNPFDVNTADLTTATGTIASINSHDIYDMLYIFGFIGFRAMDFSQMTYARIKERIAKGMNYTTDPYVERTMLLK